MRRLNEDRSAFIGLSTVEQIRAHDDVVIAVAVDVSGARHGEPEPRVHLIGFERGVWRSSQARGGPRVEEGAALVRLAVVEEGRADDHVGEAVAVDVARARYREAELRARLVALAVIGRSPRARRRSRGRRRRGPRRSCRCRRS